MNCLGLDIGSTSIKGAVLDLRTGEVRSIVRKPFPQAVTGLPAGHFEIAPHLVLDVTQAVIAQLLRDESAVDALFFSGQMGGVILVDEAGNALTNYLSWRDQRTLQPRGSGGTTLDKIRAMWTHNELLDLGSELHAGSASSLLFWLAEHDQLPKGSMPATVADFVIGKLCHSPPRMDPTQAIGLLDLHSRSWHRAAFDALGLGTINWPRVSDYRTPVGSYSFDGRKIPCHGSFGDQQCALRGVGLARDELSLNISTGSQVSQRTANFQPGPYQTRCYFDGDYLNTITHLPAGRSLNVLIDLLTELARAEGVTLTRTWDTIAEGAAAADGCGLKADLAFFAGPLGNTGRLEGITTENLTVGNLFHAAFRNMADNYVVCADRLNPNRSELSIALSGGLTRSVPVLRQLIQDRFAVQVRESMETEETLLGLLDLARTVYLR